MSSSRLCAAAVVNGRVEEEEEEEGGRERERAKCHHHHHHVTTTTLSPPRHDHHATMSPHPHAITTFGRSGAATHASRKPGSCRMTSTCVVLPGDCGTITCARCAKDETKWHKHLHANTCIVHEEVGRQKGMNLEGTLQSLGNTPLSIDRWCTIVEATVLHRVPSPEQAFFRCRWSFV